MAAANTPPTTSSLGVMNKRLLEAAISGDSTSMQAMASYDPSILLGKTPQENTCLHISSGHGHQQFCRDVMLLEESLLTDVNLDKETPLLAAVTNGHVRLASCLLERCSQQGFRQAILQKDRYGFNALHHAIHNDHTELALELIEAEPALSQAVTNCNDSPMFFAAMRNFTRVCEKLMQTPCAYSGGKHGRNSLHAAVKNGNEEIVKMIMMKCPELARETDTDIRTPVRHAVLDGKIKTLRIMLDHDSALGYDINSKGIPLLCDAGYRGQVASVKEILEHCPDAPYNDAKDKTLLHVAVLFEQAEFVKYVLDTPLLRKLVNMQDDKGKTALHYAVEKCNPEVVAALLSHEDIDATVLDKDGFTAAWAMSSNMKYAKTLNWNEVIMHLSIANPQEADSLRNLQMDAKQQTTEESRKDAKSLTKTYTSNTSIVAILIATITFAAAFTLPGGYSSDAGSEGLPIMSKKFAFQAFLIFDVLAMCSSLVVAFICIIARWGDYEFLLHYTKFTYWLMWFAYIATTTAFSTALYTVLAPQLYWLAIAICVLVSLLPIITLVLGKWPIWRLKLLFGKSFKTEFLDMV